MIAHDEVRSPADWALYGGRDPRDLPRYSFPEVARATGVPASTVAAWVRGQRYRRKSDHGFFEPVIRRPASGDTRLSFNNIIEVHVLRALRIRHEVKLGYVREALAIAEQEFGIERLLTRPDLIRTSPGRLFLERYTDFLELSPAQQLAMHSVLDQFLDRVELDLEKLPAEFYPLERSIRNSGLRLILVSPFVSFGHAVIGRVGVSTRAVADRVNTGESREEVMQDYGLEDKEFEEALLYEAAA